MLGTHTEDVEIPLTSQLNSYTRNGFVFLDILKKPEKRHRARYETEGSRGTVKDYAGIGHPIVRLNGYNRPAKLRVFIGTGSGDVAPHPFYQACHMRNFSDCVVKMVDKTVVLEMDFIPDMDQMVAICDCIGIVKLRNYDVQHRMTKGNVKTVIKSRKRSTKVRLVFRTTIMHPDYSCETIQITSETIECAQQLPRPEILTMSWRSCPANGGLELFVIGKNFSKDSKVTFYEGEAGSSVTWRVFVVPIKEYIHQCHLVCIVPPYVRTDIVEPVQVRVAVECSGGTKKSEPQPFAYTPVVGFLPTSPVTRAFPQPTDVLDVFLLEVKCMSEDFEYGEGLFHPIVLWTTQSRDSHSSSLLAITEPRPGCSTSTIQYSTSIIPPIALYMDRRRLTLPMNLMNLFEIQSESERVKHRMNFLRSQKICASSSTERPAPGEAYQVIPELDHSRAIHTQPTPDRQSSSTSEPQEDSWNIEHNKPRKMRKLRETRKKVVSSTSIPNRECTSQGSFPTIECSQQNQNIFTGASESAVYPPTTDEQAVRSLDDFVNLTAESHLSGSQSHSSSSSHFTSPYTTPEKHSGSSAERKRKLPFDTVSTVVEESPHLMFPFDESSPDSSSVNTPPKQKSDLIQSEQATQIDYLNYPGGGTYRVDTPNDSPWTTSSSLSSSSSLSLSPRASPKKSATVSPVKTSPYSSPANRHSTPLKGYFPFYQAAGTKSKCSSPDSISRPMSSMNLSTSMQKATSTTQSTQESHSSSFHSNSPLQNDPNISESLNYSNMIMGEEGSRETAEAGYSVSIASALEIAEGGAEGYYTLPITSSLIQRQLSSTTLVATNTPPTPMFTDPNTSFPQQDPAGIEEHRQYVRTSTPQRQLSSTTLVATNTPPTPIFTDPNTSFPQQDPAGIEEHRQYVRTSTPPLQQQHMQKVCTETSVSNECNIDYMPLFDLQMSSLPDLRDDLDEVLGTEFSERTGAGYSMGGLPAPDVATSGSIVDNTLSTPNPIQHTIHQPYMTPYSISHQSGYVQQNFTMSTGMNTQVSQTFFNQNEQLVRRTRSMAPDTTFSLLTYQDKPLGVEDLPKLPVTTSNPPTEDIHSSSSIHPNLPLQSPFPEIRENLDELMHVENRETTGAGYSIDINPAPEIAVRGPIGFSSLPTSSWMPSQVQYYNVSHSSQSGSRVTYTQIPPRPMSMGLQTPFPHTYPGHNEPDNTSTETGNFHISSSWPNPNNQSQN